jgi:hypothetical protein
MKHPKLKILKNKIKTKTARQDLREIILDNFLDILPYIINDVIKWGKKKGCIIDAKKPKKNKKKKKK